MSYFIYLPASNPTFNFCQEELYNIIPFQTDVNSPPLYPQHDLFMTSTFSSPQLNYIEFPLQSDSKTQILSSTEQY